ncbi:MAG: hypothetical protein HZA08_12455 [Nitrospirae bacterium]|nr:hypothetical protein [Nitrospirota bacterium]
MKKHLILFIIVFVSFLTGCGAGGGVGTVDNGLTGGNSDQNNNPPSSVKSKTAKIKIKEDGLYKLTFSDLNTASVDLSGVTTASLKMTNKGEEIAIDVVDANINGIFDEGDTVEFYGKAISRDDKEFRYTETNIYWLSSKEGEEGLRKRMREIKSNASSIQGVPSFLKVLHSEEATWYEQKNYPEISSTSDKREHWFWGEVFYTPGVAGSETGLYQRDYKFNTRGIDKSQPVQLKIRLQSVNGSHHISGYLNGTDNKLIDKIWASDNGPYEIEAEVPSSYFINGFNTLRLESVGDTESGVHELFYLDWFEVTYYHLYQAESGRLEFSGKGIIDVSNFTSDSISIYDLSDYINIKKVLPISIEETQKGFYKTVFSTVAWEEGKFIVVTDKVKKTPAGIESYTQAGIRLKDGDYIIITHEDFYDAVKPLADYRSKQGYKVTTVKIKDIYDEFSAGIETPYALKDFLTFAYQNWSPRPSYVLLVGDATIDYKDFSGYGKDYGVRSYVPAYLYNYYGLGEVPSDNWFADVNGNVLPEMNIGRIPAKSAADVTAVINKIIAHETSSAKSGNVLLIADDNDSPDITTPSIFERLSNTLIPSIIEGKIPAYVSKLYQRGYTGDFRQGIIDGINAGPLIVNYTGHGSVVNWTKEVAFSSEDVDSLARQSDYPFVVALNCLNGYFVLPDDGVEYVEQGGAKQRQYPSIAESFLMTPEKGAVAVWAASAIGYPSEHDPLAGALYDIVFNQENLTLGEAVTKAKEVVFLSREIPPGDDIDVVQTFIFFGDPATRLK